MVETRAERDPMKGTASFVSCHAVQGGDTPCPVQPWEAAPGSRSVSRRSRGDHRCMKTR